LIINNKRYKGTHGLWRLLTNPNKKLDKDTYESWWANKDNFTEKDYTLYKEILNKTHSIYQNNDQTTKKNQSLVVVKNGKKFVSLIWKEIKPTKSAYGLMKYN